jgi:hypothetical protein
MQIEIDTKILETMLAHVAMTTRSRATSTVTMWSTESSSDLMVSALGTAGACHPVIQHR